MIQGKCKTELPGIVAMVWVDVRDTALAHVKAVEVAEAAKNKRFFVTAGNFSHQDIAQVIRKDFPEYRDGLPEGVKGGEYPDGGHYGYDNSRTREVLGVEFRGLEESVVDTVKSLKELGA